MCDPLQRRYVRIPSVPGDLTADFTSGAYHQFPSFFAPTGEEGSSFRVIWMIYDYEEEGDCLRFLFSDQSVA